jgi:hypothetical protein
VNEGARIPRGGHSPARVGHRPRRISPATDFRRGAAARCCTPT